MTLKKIKLGDYICQYSKVCGIPNLSNEDVSGVKRDKEFFEPSQQVGSDTSKYKIVPPKHYACNLMHVGRDKVLPIALNHTDKNKIVSPAYFVFSFMDNEDILTEYFFILLKCNERDRYFWFHTDGSVRDGMSWDELCDVELEVPSIDIQRKYVAIYNSMVANQKAYEMGLEDLKLTCDAYIEELRRNNKQEQLKKYIEISDKPNTDRKFSLGDVTGVSADKKLIRTKADASNNDLSKFTIVNEEEFVYNPRNGIAIALNTSNRKFIISWNNTAFRIKEIYKRILLPQFVFMFLCRNEWNRKTRFLSWGSSTEVFSFEALGETLLPIVDYDIQKDIVSIFNVYNDRKQINEQLKNQIKNICPILIKGSIEDAKKAVS